MDFDGSFFKSLSLDDSIQREQFNRLTFQAIDEDDFMDLDEPDMIEEIIEDPFEPIEVLQNYLVEEKEQEIPSILSPTSLGAYIATKPRLLLMAPPEVNKPVATGYDFEFATSDMKQRNTSILQKSKLEEFLAKDDEEYVFDLVKGYVEVPKGGSDRNNRENRNDSNDMMENSMSRSYAYRQMNYLLHGQGPTVHHHHYYSHPGGVNSQGANPTELGAFNSHAGSAQAGIFNQQSKDSKSFNAQPDVMHNSLYPYGQTLDTALQTSPFQNHFMSNSQIQPYQNDRKVFYSLPPPWKSDIHPHERYPYILSSYLQLLINLLISGYGLQLVYSIIATIKKDIELNIAQQTYNLLLEIETCRKSWIENQCHPDTIVPLLQRQCDYWYECMNQKPHLGGKIVATSAQTIGIIVNSLVEPLSFKFLLILVLCVLLVFGLNFIFGYVRAKMYYGETSSKHIKA